MLRGKLAKRPEEARKGYHPLVSRKKNVQANLICIVLTVWHVNCNHYYQGGWNGWSNILVAFMYLNWCTFLTKCINVGRERGMHCLFIKCVTKNAWFCKLVKFMLYHRTFHEWVRSNLSFSKKLCKLYPTLDVMSLCILC